MIRVAPQASPVARSAVPTRPAAGPAPMRRPDPVGPVLGGLPTPPLVGPSRFQQIAEALALLSKEGQAFAREYFRGVRADEAALADAQATQDVLERDVRTWAQAVAARPELAQASPYFRSIYEARLARTAVQRRGVETLAAYLQDPISASTDPTEVFGWLRERFKDSLEGLTGPALAAATEELRAQAEYLVKNHTRQAAQNLVAENQASFEAAVAAAFDEAAQRRTPLEALAARLDALQMEARAQGLPGHVINATLAKMTGEAMVRHMRADFAALGERPRPDGTPGYGRTAQGRQIIASAQDRIMSRMIQAENLAWTREQRAARMARESAYRAVADELYGQLEAGEVPTLSPETLRALARVDPDAARQAVSLMENVRTFQDTAREDPQFVSMLFAGVYSGSVDEADLVKMRTQGHISNQTFQSLYRARRDFETHPIYGHPAVREIIQGAKAIVGNPDPIAPNIFRNQVAANRVEADLLAALHAHVQANPRATTGELIEWLAGERERIVGLPGYGAQRRVEDERRRMEGERPHVERPRNEWGQVDVRSGPLMARVARTEAETRTLAERAVGDVRILRSPLEAQLRNLAEDRRRIEVSLETMRTLPDGPNLYAQGIEVATREVADLRRREQALSAALEAIREARPVEVPAEAVARGEDGRVLPHRPTGTPPESRHILSLVVRLMTTPDDVEAVRAFDRTFGPNAAFHYLTIYNRSLTPPR